MMEQPITEMQAIEIIRNTMKEIPAYKVYYTMKLMNLSRIYAVTVKKMRACLAIHLHGLPITTPLLNSVLIESPSQSDLPGAVTILHSLGDKNCLVMKRGTKSKKRLEWVVSPVFLKYYNGEMEDV